MKIKKYFFCLLLTGFTAVSSQAQTKTYSLTVTIHNFKSDDGLAHIALLDTGRKKVLTKAVAIRGQKVRLVMLKIPAGRYAVRLYQDENSNDKLDTGMFGIPEEPWGCSNDVKPEMGPPKFTAMLFDLKSDKNISITMNK